MLYLLTWIIARWRLPRRTINLNEIGSVHRSKLFVWLQEIIMNLLCFIIWILCCGVTFIPAFSCVTWQQSNRIISEKWPHPPFADWNYFFPALRRRSCLCCFMAWNNILFLKLIQVQRKHATLIVLRRVQWIFFKGRTRTRYGAHMRYPSGLFCYALGLYFKCNYTCLCIVYFLTWCHRACLHSH